MAAESETAEEKNLRLNKLMRETVQNWLNNKIGKPDVFGQTRVVINWKAGHIDSIVTEDSLSHR